MSAATSPRASWLWDRTNQQHALWFLTHVLAPLISITRPRDMATRELALEAATMWILALRDVPADVLLEAVDRLVLAGPEWMPKPAHLREAAAAVVADRRKALDTQAARLLADCTQCDGTGFETVRVEGYSWPFAKPCGCRARAAELKAGKPSPLALPPAPRVEAPAEGEAWT